MICGTATFTIVASTMIIATPRLRKNRPAQRRRESLIRDAPFARSLRMLSVPSQCASVRLAARMRPGQDTPYRGRDMAPDDTPPRDLPERGPGTEGQDEVARWPMGRLLSTAARLVEHEWNVALARLDL